MAVISHRNADSIGRNSRAPPDLAIRRRSIISRSDLKVREFRSGVVLLETEALEALVEARQLATGVENTAGAAGPRRMGPRVDVEANRVAFLAVGATGLEAAPIGQHHVNGVIVGMDFFLHGRALFSKPRRIRV